MIWYLAALFRGTAEPPILPSSSPLHKLLAQYGATVARRPALFVAFSAAIATTFGYLFVLLFTLDPSLSALKPPSRVWSSNPVPEHGESMPELGIRQAWIFGDNMKALERDVLEETLNIQGTLLGPIVNYAAQHPAMPLASTSVDATQHSQDGVPDVSSVPMFFHSPLMCWNDSASAIRTDLDGVETVNRCSRLRSPFHVPLRYSSILGGISLEGNRIVAADALVISLLYPRGSKAEGIWALGAKSIAATERYEVYPHDGSSKSTQYNFRYRATTFSDLLPSAVAFILTAVYLLWGVRNIKSLRSRVVIAAGAVTQICISTLMALVILAFIDPQLLRIPPKAYFFVAFVIGFDNSFRLTDAVIKTPSERPSTYRISKTLGDVGYLSIIAAAEDLSVLWILSYLSRSPRVKAFCVFTAVALVCDLFLHATFFLAILSAALRKLEVGSSMDDKSLNLGVPQRIRRVALNVAKEGKSQWSYDIQLKQPTLRIRTVGIVLLICTVTALNWNGTAHKSPYGLARPPEHALAMDAARSPASVTALNGITDALKISSPSKWLKTQDASTLMEGIQAIGLNERSYVANVYDPLIVFVNGPHRARLSSPGKGLPLSSGVRMLERHYHRLLLYSALTFAVAGLLVRTLLHGKGDAQDERTAVVEEKISHIKIDILGPVHDMDIIMLTASTNGVIAAVGLDRQIRVWRLKGKVTCESINAVPSDDHRILWPIAAIAIDDQAEWLAILPRIGNISFWNINTSQFGPSTPIKDQGSNLISFYFTPKSQDANRPSNASLIMTSKGGLMTEVEIGKTEAIEHRISNDVLQFCRPIHSSRLPLRLVSATKYGRMYVTMKRGRLWFTQKIHWPNPFQNSPQDLEFIPVSELGMFGLVRSSSSPEAYLLDIQLSAVIYRFRLTNPQAQSLRTFHSSRQPCRSCGASAVGSFSLAYKTEDIDEFVMHTFTANRIQQERGYLICLRTERNVREKRCAGFEQAFENVYRTEMAGVWEATRFNCVAGIREGSRKTSAARKAQQALASRGLVRRKSDLRHNTDADLGPEEEHWEAWAMFSTGEVMTYAMPENTHEEETSLLVTRVGPACAVGRKSVAVAFGNAIKMVLLGNELYEDVDDEGLNNRNLRSRRPIVRRPSLKIDM